MTDEEITAAVTPDNGLPSDFLRLAAERLRAQGIEADLDWPAVLVFHAKGREWVTGETGLHVNDYEGNGESLPGDEALVALERQGTISLAQYLEILVGLIRD